jgi:hypothetical protein
VKSNRECFSEGRPASDQIREICSERTNGEILRSGAISFE